MKIRRLSYLQVQSFLLLSSFGLGRVNINVGFSIKPYMISGIIIAIHLMFKRGKLTIPVLYPLERAYLLFLSVVALSFIHAVYPNDSLRFTANAMLIVFFYFIIRTFYLSFFTVDLFESSLKKAGTFVLIVNLAYYLIGLLMTGLNFHGNNISYYGLLLDRGSPRLSGLASDDPNIAALFFSMFFVFFLVSKGKAWQKHGFLILILLSFSRGAYLGILAMTVCGLLLKIKQRKLLGTAKGIVLASVPLIMMFALANNLLKLDIVGVADDRFSTISSDGGSGRNVLWKDALNTFNEYPILGIGANGSVSYNTESYNNHHYVHNTHLEVLSELGILGAAIYVIWLALMLIGALHITKQGFDAPYLLLVSIIVQITFLSVMTQEVIMMSVFIIFFYLYKLSTKVSVGPRTRRQEV